jgi:hypothetical protein
MNWEKYLKETDESKRWDMLQEGNRLSYDHVDDWLMSLKYFLDNLHKEQLEKEKSKWLEERGRMAKLLFKNGVTNW